MVCAELITTCVCWSASLILLSLAILFIPLYLYDLPYYGLLPSIVDLSVDVDRIEKDGRRIITVRVGR